MTEVDEEWVEETFGDRVDEVDDVTLDDVIEWYSEKLDKYGDQKMARVAVQSDFNSWINTGADGNVRMITIGAQDDPFNNGDVFVGYALCIPEDDPVKLGAIEFRRDRVDADSMMHHFYEPFTPVTGEFKIKNAEKPVGSNAYQLEAVESTQLEEFEAEKDREERKEMVNDYVPEAKIAEIGESLSLTNDNGFAAAFGVDIRRIPQAYVHEVRIGDNAARLVVQDDSFVDARDLGNEVTGGEDGDQGLAGFADPELIDFGEASFVDLYGALTPTEDGQVLMSIIGAEVIEGTEPPSSGSSDDSDSGSASSEETVGSGGAGAQEERTI